MLYTYLLDIYIVYIILSFSYYLRLDNKDQTTFFLVAVFCVTDCDITFSVVVSQELKPQQT